MLDKINQDLKQAMLGGDKQLTEVLKGLKSAVQYARVAAGEELSDEDIQSVFQKEQKKRSDAVSLYRQAGDEGRAQKELYEKEVIAKYLPEQLTEQEIEKLVDKAIAEIGSNETKNMGKIISLVKQSSGQAADGAIIAKLVKGKLS